MGHLTPACFSRPINTFINKLNSQWYIKLSNVHPKEHGNIQEGYCFNELLQTATNYIYNAQSIPAWSNVKCNVEWLKLSKHFLDPGLHHRLSYHARSTKIIYHNFSIKSYIWKVDTFLKPNCSSLVGQVR